MRAFGYKQSSSDHSLFVKYEEGKVTTLIIYVDDMVLMEHDLDKIKLLQEYLATEFE